MTQSNARCPSSFGGNYSLLRLPSNCLAMSNYSLKMDSPSRETVMLPNNVDSVDDVGAPMKVKAKPRTLSQTKLGMTQALLKLLILIQQ